MQITELPEEKIFILFDGVCNFCNNTVNTIIQKDKKDQFRFIALQSELGQKICKHLQIDQTKIDSIVYYQPNVAYYIKSGAAFELSKKIGGIYYLLTIFSVLPSSITDWAYDFIAKNRYNWFGKKDQCMIPDAKIREKFLE